MKIENTGSQGISRAQRNDTQAVEAARAAQSRAAAKPAAGSDRLELSDQAQMLAKARKTLAAQPEVRADKVQALRISIENGTYQVPHAQLARRLKTQL
ncbi:MAG: flagellar biosynthesis anti-sigma factor FlgM [Anaerolineales bacterium]|nr:flagellar biosynthesis anti-sigma factor FlgM [Anaerolineales bacterium]